MPLGGPHGSDVTSTEGAVWISSGYVCVEGLMWADLTVPGWASGPDWVLEAKMTCCCTN